MEDRPKRWPFDLAWRRLEKRSRCDALGGMEYRRVVGEWFAAGCPGEAQSDDTAIEEFIIRRANLGPQ